VIDFCRQGTFTKKIIWEELLATEGLTLEDLLEEEAIHSEI